MWFEKSFLCYKCKPLQLLYTRVFFWTLKLINLTCSSTLSFFVATHKVSVFSHTLNFALPCPSLPLGLSFCYWFLSLLVLQGPVELLSYWKYSLILLIHLTQKVPHFWAFWILLRSSLQNQLPNNWYLTLITSVPSEY